MGVVGALVLAALSWGLYKLFTAPDPPPVFGYYYVRGPRFWLKYALFRLLLLIRKVRYRMTISFCIHIKNKQKKQQCIWWRYSLSERPVLQSWGTNVPLESLDAVVEVEQLLSRAKETAPFFQRGRISVGSSGFALEEREAGKPWLVRHHVTHS